MYARTCVHMMGMLHNTFYVRKKGLQGSIRRKLDVSKNPICTDKTRTTMLLVIDSLKVRGLWDEKEQGDKKK
jgi:hypothetical protein